jgi:hypothetical protein
MDDLTACVIACEAAQSEGHEISDGCARTIAALWRETLAGEEFVSTGIIKSDTLWREFGSTWAYEDEDGKLCLDMLGTYLANRESRSAVPGWHRLWVR